MIEQQCQMVNVQFDQANILQVPGFTGNPVPPGTSSPVPSGKTPTAGVAPGTKIPVPVMPVLGTPTKEYYTLNI